MTLAASPTLARSLPAKKKTNPWIIAFVVSMATFMEVMDTSIANVSLSHIGGNLGTSVNESTWVLTSYLVANAIVLPISGWLSNVFGRKRFYMTCVLLFTIASFLCGFAPTLGWLLFFRILQGIGGGGLAASEQAILADTFEPRQRGMAFAVYGLAVVLAPAIGPTLGGWITDNYSWRWIFFINIPVGIVSLILSGRLVEDSKHAVEEHEAVWRGGLKIDYVGFVLVALGVGCLQVVLDKGQEDDWLGSRFIQIFAVLCVIGVIGAIFWETMVAKEPVVDLRLLKRPSFLIANILMFMVGFVLNSTTVLLPQFVQQLLGYNATQAGMILMGGGFTLLCVMPFAGALTRFVQPKWLMMTGLLITAGSMWHMTGFNTQVSFNHLVWARVYQCLGLPLFFVSLNTIAYSDLPPGKSNNASALMNLMRNLGGGVGISIAITLLERRSVFHFDRLAAHLSEYDFAFMERFRTMTKFFGGGPDGQSRAISAMYFSILQQAQMLAYIDVFKLGVIGCLLVVGLVIFLKKIKPGAKVEGGGH